MGENIRSEMDTFYPHYDFQLEKLKEAVEMLNREKPYVLLDVYLLNEDSSGMIRLSIHNGMDYEEIYFGPIYLAWPHLFAPRP